MSFLTDPADAWQGARFVGYDAKDGVWRFEVEHFSRYGLLDSDDDEPDKGPGEGGAGRAARGGPARAGDRGGCHQHPGHAGAPQRLLPVLCCCRWRQGVRLQVRALPVRKQLTGTLANPSTCQLTARIKSTLFW